MIHHSYVGGGPQRVMPSSDPPPPVPTIPPELLCSSAAVPVSPRPSCLTSLSSSPPPQPYPRHGERPLSANTTSTRGSKQQLRPKKSLKFTVRLRSMASQPGLSSKMAASSSSSTPDRSHHHEQQQHHHSSTPPSRSKSQRFKDIIQHPIRSISHSDLIHHHQGQQGQQKPSALSKSNTDINQRGFYEDDDQPLSFSSSRTRYEQLQRQKLNGQPSNSNSNSNSASSTPLHKLFNYTNTNTKPMSQSQSEELRPVLSTSAPSSRSHTRIYSDDHSKDGYEQDRPRRLPATASTTPTLAGTLPEKHRFRFRSKSLKSANGSPSPAVEDAVGTIKAILPSMFLPEYLLEPNWSLSSKYSTHKQSIIKSKYIGRGATAVVKTVQSNSTKDLFACKVYHRKSPVPNQPQEEYYKRLAEEYEIATRLNHRNVIRTLDLCVDSTDSWCCVMEYCDQGDLFTLIEAFKLERKRMPRNERNCLFKQLLMGLHYMHDQGITHRDIKPENLLLNSRNQLKITDFGVSTACMDGKGELWLAHGLCGSTPYMSPEVFEKHKSGYDSRKSDIWACAIVYANMAFNGGLFAKADPEDPGYARFVSELDKYWTMEDGLQKYLDNEASTQTTSDSSMLTPMTQSPSQSQPESEAASPIATNMNYDNIPIITRDEYLFVNSNGGADQPLSFFSDFGESGKRLIARMLTPDDAKRPLLPEIVQSGFVKRIGMCIGTDPREEPSGIDATSVSAIRKIKADQVVRNHNHKPPTSKKKLS